VAMSFMEANCTALPSTGFRAGSVASKTQPRPDAGSRSTIEGRAGC